MTNNMYTLIGGPLNNTAMQCSVIRGLIKVESWGPVKDERFVCTYTVVSEDEATFVECTQLTKSGLTSGNT